MVNVHAILSMLLPSQYGSRIPSTESWSLVLGADQFTINQQGIAMGILVQLSGYILDRIRDEGEFILYRAHAQQTKPPSVLLLALVATRSNPQTLKKTDHELSLKSGTGLGRGGTAPALFRARRADWSGPNQVLQLVI